MQEFMMLILPSDLWTYFNRGPTALFGVQPVSVQIPHVCEFQRDKLFDNLGKDLRRNLYTRTHNFEVSINTERKRVHKNITLMQTHKLTRWMSNRYLPWREISHFEAKPQRSDSLPSHDTAHKKTPATSYFRSCLDFPPPIFCCRAAKGQTHKMGVCVNLSPAFNGLQYVICVLKSDSPAPQQNYVQTWANLKRGIWEEQKLEDIIRHD